MNPEPDDWSPTPELLAAYFDGELAGRPDLAALRRRIAGWLRGHPEARAVLGDYRRLAQLWQDTAPPDPGVAAWAELDAHLAAVSFGHGGVTRRRLLVRWGAGAIAVAAAIALAVWLGRSRPDAQLVQAPTDQRITAPELDVLPVATAAEVTILRVEGEDTQTLVVGELPLHGPLELADPGEVALTSVQPDAHDRMMPHVRIHGPHRPMIWARVAAELTEP